MNTQSQAGMIRSLLSKKVAPETIVKRVAKALGGKPTVAYVNWIAKTTRKASKRKTH